MKELKPINIVNGETVYDLNADEASSDSIRAARLVKAAKAGDEKAKKKLEIMMKSKMVVEE